MYGIAILVEEKRTLGAQGNTSTQNMQTRYKNKTKNNLNIFNKVFFVKKFNLLNL